MTLLLDAMVSWSGLEARWHTITTVILLKSVYAIRDRCVGVSIETVLQIVKLYTVVNEKNIFKNLTFRTVVLRRSPCFDQCIWRLLTWFDAWLVVSWPYTVRVWDKVLEQPLSPLDTLQVLMELGDRVKPSHCDCEQLRDGLFDPLLCLFAFYHTREQKIKEWRRQI